jgi:putative transcriptional regulator
MLKVHLSRLMGERRLKISDVSRLTGIDRGTITRLYQETARRVDLDTLDQLCRVLDCGVGDILEYIPESGNGQSG